jgi:hypothetical protein
MKQGNKSPFGDTSVITKALTRLQGAKAKLSKGNLRAARVVLVMLVLIGLCLPAMFESSAMSGQDPHERPKPKPPPRAQ